MSTAEVDDCDGKGQRRVANVDLSLMCLGQALHAHRLRRGAKNNPHRPGPRGTGRAQEDGKDGVGCVPPLYHAEESSS